MVLSLVNYLSSKMKAFHGASVTRLLPLSNATDSHATRRLALHKVQQRHSSLDSAQMDGQLPSS
jgi:hypothetical protein